MMNKHIKLFFVLLLVIFLISGCTADNDEDSVNLSDKWVVQNPVTTTMPVQEEIDYYLVSVGPESLSPDKIMLNDGDLAEINFTIGDSVDFPIDIRSDLWESTGVLRSGDKMAIRFIASMNITYSSYNSETNELIASGEIIVQ